MPKYIRTKDGIYDFLKYHRLEDYKRAGFTDEEIVEIYGKNKKISDTIEELCDAFVFVVENQGYLTLENYNRAKEIVKSYNQDENKYVCYGAIWTDKGLVYVAKMNSNGELELL